MKTNLLKVFLLFVCMCVSGAFSSAWADDAETVTITTSKKPGETIKFMAITAADDGIIEIEGLEGTWMNDQTVEYTVVKPTFTLKGDIKQINCKDCGITAIDISACSRLKKLVANYNVIEKLVIGENNVNLEHLAVGNNKLNALDVTMCGKIKWIECNNNNIQVLDLHNAPNLDWLNCHHNPIEKLDFSNNKKITGVLCNNMKLTELDFSMCENMDRVLCYNNGISQLNLANNKKLTRLQCDYNKISNIDLSANTALTWFSCNGNMLEEINFTSQMSVLSRFECDGNKLTRLDVSRCPSLTRLTCTKNHIAGVAMDQLIESITKNNSGETKGFFGVFNNTDGDEQNVCTKKQVKKLAEKNWTAKERKLNSNGKLVWFDYEGSEDSGCCTIVDDDAQVSAIHDVSGRKLNDVEPGLNIITYSNGTTKKVYVR